VITAYDLVERLRQSGSKDTAIQAAVALLLASSPSTEIPETMVDVERLLPIYQRRLRRAPPDVLGLGDLVERLSSPEAATVLVAVHTSRGQVTTIMRTPDGALLGCVVGPDRRADTGADESDR
jgi:hypothetical protein